MEQLNMSMDAGKINLCMEDNVKPLSPVAVQSDEFLWHCFRDGDQNAYSLLLRKHDNILFSYGSRFSKDEDFVKDCIQDVFFELWNRRERIKQTPCVKAYLFKSLRLRIF